MIHKGGCPGPCNLISWLVALGLLSILSCASAEVSRDKVVFNEFYAETLKLKVDMEASSPGPILLYYWPEGSRSKDSVLMTALGRRSITYVSKLDFGTKYFFQFKFLSTTRQTKLFTFKTTEPTTYISPTLKVLSNNNVDLIDSTFPNGAILINKREAPGAVFLINSAGKTLWSHHFNNLGVRVAHFTADQTLLCILGSEKDPTSYGRQLVELEANGTIRMKLETGQNDFKYIPHHEVLKTPEGNIVYLFLEKRILDLSRVGGNKADTVTGDGIQVLSPFGKEIWKWSIFDAVDPLKYKNILREKSDWLHANSLSYDQDGNFLISFFKTSEVWKIHSKTGQIIWRFGQNKTKQLPPPYQFEQLHAFHAVGRNKYLMYDNYSSGKKPHVRGYQIDPATQTVTSFLNISLPKEYYSNRMGSSYFVSESTILTCCSKAKKLVLTNKTGAILWALSCDKITPYRAEFIHPTSLRSFLNKK